jgi:cytochrome c oxidase cbb3-type subunit 4
MTYETAAFISHLITLAVFGGVMLGVLIHAFRPSNKARFDTVARLALEDDSDFGEGGNHGRS